MREAVAEIKKVAKREPVVAAEGAILFLERVSPALAHVDSSSGAIGAAVNRAIEELVAIIAAIRLAEASRGPWTSDLDVARLCEEILLSSGLVDEAFERYAAEANTAGTYLGTFRAVTKKYPSKPPDDVLARLIASTPGDEGKWFAAAKDAGLLDAALVLAKKTPTDPRTLARAARDHVATAPAFALEAGLIALDWIARGHGYEITSADVWAAYLPAKEAAERLGVGAEFRTRLRDVAYTRGESFVGQALRGQLVDA